MKTSVLTSLIAVVSMYATSSAQKPQSTVQGDWKTSLDHALSKYSGMTVSDDREEVGDPYLRQTYSLGYWTMICRSSDKAFGYDFKPIRVKITYKVVSSDESLRLESTCEWRNNSET